MCSMTFGRPPLIPNSYMLAPLPKNVELDQLENGYDEPSEITAGQPKESIGIFVQTLCVNTYLNVRWLTLTASAVNCI